MRRPSPSNALFLPALGKTATVLLVVAWSAAAPASGNAAAVTAQATAETTGGLAATEVTDGGPVRTRGSVQFKSRPRARRPRLRSFRVAPTQIPEGTLPKITVRIDQRGVRTVRLRVVLVPAGSNVAALTTIMPQAPTGTRIEPQWPAGAQLAAGSYFARIHATGPKGGKLLRGARAAGRIRVVVTSAPPPAPELTPAPPPTAGGIFPIAGPHNYGGEDARFNADRGTHRHEGQDVLAAEGTPVVTPTAGVVHSVGYQQNGAGFYVVVDAADGRAFFFAHCQAGSVVVTGSQLLTLGQQLCNVGHTGHASGPHLHFEIWLGGWRRNDQSYPIDPLPQLQAWDR